MKYRIRVIVVIVLILTALSAGCGNSVTQNTSPQTTSETLPILPDFNGVNSGVSRSANGLSLSLSLDAKTYKPGDTINMMVSEWNTISKTNDVAVSDKWPINGLSLGICGTLSFPFGVAILRGYYTADNISTATPLILYNPNGIVQGCLPPVLNVTAYHFKPLSDIATLDGTVIDQSATFEMSSKVDVWNYWWGDRPNAVLRNFEPGVYTVVAGDEWVTLAVLHFTVTE